MAVIPGSSSPFDFPRAEEWTAQYGDLVGALFAKSMGDRLLHAFQADIGADIGQLAVAWQASPEELLSIQQDWLASVGEITARYAVGAHDAGDQRSELGSRELHAALVAAVNRYVSDAPTEDRHLKDRLTVASRLWVSALSPENFMFSNPEVRAEAGRSHGESVRRGMQNFESDLRESAAGLRVRTAEADGYEVGESLAVTPGEVVFQNELLQLIQYYPSGAEVHKAPLMIIPPWINKYYVLDLTPTSSMVRWLLQQGHTVFMISWVNPDAEYAETDFDDYLGKGCLPVLQVIREITGESKVDVMGYCIGGVLAACLAAWHAAGDGGDVDGFDINSLTLLNTLLDYSDPGDVGVYLASNMMAAIDGELSERGYLDGSIMSVAFGLLRAERNYWPQFVNSYLKGQSPKRDPLSYWNFDATNLPASMARQYLQDFYTDNRLARQDSLELCGRKLNLARLGVPIIAVACKRDHLVPWRAAYAGAALSGKAIFILASGGHVSGVLRAPGTASEEKSVSYRLSGISGKADDWKRDTAVRQGSWWTAWSEEMTLNQGSMVPARFPGGKEYPALEPAPGSYVLAKTQRQ